MTAIYSDRIAQLPDPDVLFDRIGWQIDHLMSLDTRGKGIIPALYQAAVAEVNAPLAMTAARRIREVVKKGDVVGLITGFPSRSFLKRGITETDGPVGVVYLARVLEQVLDAVPVIIIDRELQWSCYRSSHAAGLLVTGMDEALLAKRGKVNASAVAFLDCPVDDAEAQRVARDFLNEIAPKALVAIEMPSLASDGFAHMASGRAVVHEHLAKADHFFHIAKEMGILRVGLGDGGNEMGMANIKDTLVRISPVGETIAASTDSDVPVVGASSNWAAFAIGMCIEAMSGSTSINRDIDLPAIIRRCAEDGAIDGFSVRPEAKVDGTPIPLNTSLIDLMAWVVDRALAEADKGWLK